ncbi:MAG TPA: FAD-dependent monooxygenase [Aestuariivirga sp.]|nr:FAD-dependent monooxygenase [Aestuariivirga sp.]
MTDFDAIVAGAGPAGLAAAALLARDGKRTALVTGKTSAEPDPRTVALMQPSIRMLEYLGLWPGSLRAQTAPLRKLRLVDDTGAAVRAPTLTFDAAELGEEVFGWNIPLSLLIPALRARAAELGVAFIDDEVVGAATGEGAISVKLASGAEVSARVALAADGRNSRLRQAAGIGTEEWSYDQVAIATSFAHSAPHFDVSTEYHRQAGPFTTVPMPEGRSSLVWMERPTRAAQLMALDDAALAVEIQIANHGELGLVSQVGPRKAFPMRGLVARQFAARRTLLVGEAAHVVPPIGAQGLNMSLRDAAQAADLILAGDDAGSDDVMRDYETLRRRDVVPRQQAIDLMNRSLLSGFLVMEGARAAGLALLRNFTPLRHFVMRRGLGVAGPLPHAMRPHGKTPALMK